MWYGLIFDMKVKDGHVAGRASVMHIITLKLVAGRPQDASLVNFEMNFFPPCPVYIHFPLSCTGTITAPIRHVLWNVDAARTKVLIYKRRGDSGVEWQRPPDSTKYCRLTSRCTWYISSLIDMPYIRHRSTARSNILLRATQFCCGTSLERSSREVLGNGGTGGIPIEYAYAHTRMMVRRSGFWSSRLESRIRSKKMCKVVKMKMEMKASRTGFSNERYELDGNTSTAMSFNRVSIHALMIRVTHDSRVYPHNMYIRNRTRWSQGEIKSEIEEEPQNMSRRAHMYSTW
ncbi:hypothetical protein Hypma_003836 [Hypsizygus marmoreus]|uniref:Uncharacterized protein n=1 Tax=Hypsizygus marmoreus TaxID=39966 RepID=A0A369K6U2_HYPMA|nr:hypothetical protein Hypma_003836 [Hypsizygus marmoreus]